MSSLGVSILAAQRRGGVSGLGQCCVVPGDVSSITASGWERRHALRVSLPFVSVLTVGIAVVLGAVRSCFWVRAWLDTLTAVFSASIRERERGFVSSAGSTTTSDRRSCVAG